MWHMHLVEIIGLWNLNTTPSPFASLMQDTYIYQYD